MPDFLRHCGTSNFSCPPFDFLDVVARQFGESRSSVKHAALALTVASRTDGWRYFGDREKMNAFVLRQTSKALTHLLQQSTPPEDSLGRRAHREVVMTMCAILSRLAHYQQDLATFKLHLVYGRRAMQEWRDVDFDRSSIGGLGQFELLNYRQCRESKLVFLGGNTVGVQHDKRLRNHL